MNTSITLNLHRVDNVKTKAKSTLIVNLLKKFDIPGSQAVRMFHQNGAEYLVRKAFLLEYRLYKNLPVDDRKRWLIACINNDWNESDEFKEWYEHRKDNIIKTGNQDLIGLVKI